MTHLDCKFANQSTLTKEKKFEFSSRMPLDLKKNWYKLLLRIENTYISI